MAEHKRTTIRKKVVEILTAGVSDVQGRVFQSRKKSLFYGEELPLLNVWQKKEPSSKEESRPEVIQDRKLELVIEGAVKVVGDQFADDLLNELGRQVEEVMNANQKLNCLALDSELVDTEFGYSEDGEVPFGAIRLTFQIWYRTGGQFG